MMLIYPVVVLSLEREFNQPYAELLPLAFAGFVLYGVAALPAGWLADRFSAGRSSRAQSLWRISRVSCWLASNNGWTS